MLVRCCLYISALSNIIHWLNHLLNCNIINANICYFLPLQLFQANLEQRTIQLISINFIIMPKCIMYCGTTLDYDNMEMSPKTELVFIPDGCMVNSSGHNADGAVPISQ